MKNKTRYRIRLVFEIVSQKALEQYQIKPVNPFTGISMTSSCIEDRGLCLSEHENYNKALEHYRKYITATKIVDQLPGLFYKPKAY